ncbi:patatin-like phospholipase family protein [Rhodococcus maanshanensis]|uniref:patatin-like phospholipase family protein n=1 Tax=Rhodococcus maanshanensis TaxID=183556 RepID=UPI0022B40009|nr:patatin-like phospholipase family protein [Rhodococcus maanshanensis]MCZ4558161.1 patatin-like phospholipase family protein [Rhodococcus maanshanensis]
MAERIGLVVAGAGARGAFEAGAMATLAKRMAADNTPPSILVGTSAGALNVVGLGGLFDLGVVRAADELARRWGLFRLDDVFEPVNSVVGSGLRYLAQIAGIPVRLPSLLDTDPLRDTLKRMLPWDRLHENIAAGTIGAVAVTATSVATRGTVVFVERNSSVDLPLYDASRNITYVDTMLTVDHVLASAAVPALFRPVHVPDSHGWSGWYVDGGLLLNTPLKPAIDFGADLLGVVATHPPTWPTGFPSEQPTHTGKPDVFGAAALSMRAMLADRMIEDLRAIERRNEHARVCPEIARQISFIFAGPALDQAGEIAALADRIFNEQFACLRGTQNPSLWALARLIGGEAADRGDLLSFLFFDPAFTEAAAELGRAVELVESG